MFTSNINIVTASYQNMSHTMNLGVHFGALV